VAVFIFFSGNRIEV